MIEELKKEVKQLKLKCKIENDIDLKIKLTREYHKKALEVISLIHESDKTRKGLTARELIAKVESMPNLPKFGTGIAQLDSSLSGGFQTGLFVNLAGESGAGKTTMLLNILANMSESRKTVFFNFEMGDRLFVQKLKKLQLTENQMDNLIIDSDSSSLEDMIMEIELYAEDNIKFFAIDSKMKIRTQDSLQEYQSISKMSSELARLAARKDIVIFLINQMNEEDIKNKRLAFKGSGDQKYDSDIALFLVKDGDKRKLVCSKNRQNDKIFSFDIRLEDYRDCDKPIVVEFNGGL